MQRVPGRESLDWDSARRVWTGAVLLPRAQPPPPGEAGHAEEWGALHGQYLPAELPHEVPGRESWDSAPLLEWSAEMLVANVCLEAS